jgi:hypothetical protein
MWRRVCNATKGAGSYGCSFFRLLVSGALSMGCPICDLIPVPVTRSGCFSGCWRCGRDDPGVLVDDLVRGRF